MNELLSSTTQPMSIAPPAQDMFTAEPLSNAQATAAQVAELLREGRSGEAVLVLDAAQRGQPQAVQQALDRMVSAELGMSLMPTCPGAYSASLQHRRRSDRPCTASIRPQRKRPPCPTRPG